MSGVEEVGPTKVLVDGLAFPEGPRWHDGRLYFVDMLDRRVYSANGTGELTCLATMEDGPSGVGWLPSGDMIVVSMYHEQLLRVTKDGVVSTYADLGDVGGFGINDMVIAKSGRAYVGQFGGAKQIGATPSPLIVVQPDGTVGTARITKADGLMIGNGIRLTDDGKTLVVAESAACRISLFDVDEAGELSNRRKVDLPEGHHPDGLCLDAEGGIWVAALWNGVIRITHDGTVTHKITLEDGYHAYACMFGGADRRTLYLCTAGPYDNELARKTRKGRIETLAPGFTGAGLD
jgi:sugar lactone lactonase YvrE